MSKEAIYPSWRYHATKPAAIVHSSEAEEALGEGWEHSPAYFENVAEETEGSTEDVAEETGSSEAPIKKTRTKKVK